MAENFPITDPWVRARNRYLEDLDEEEQKSFQTASIENLFYSATASQKDHEMNSKTRFLFRKLEPLVAAIDQYGKALDVFSNTNSLAISPIWGSIRVVLQVPSLISSRQCFSATKNIETCTDGYNCADCASISELFREVSRHV